MNHTINRAAFLQKTALASAGILLSSIESFSRAEQKVIRVAIIGCGSVSNRYIVHLQSSSLVKIVSLCDIKIERAKAQNEKYNIGANTYDHIDALLKGVPFDLMLTLTDMQMHGALNKIALVAGKNVWSEKP
jgi:predicted dehydrogenase